MANWFLECPVYNMLRKVLNIDIKNVNKEMERIANDCNNNTQ